MAESPPSARAPRERLFFALWPPHPLRQQLSAASAEAIRRQRLAGKPSPPAKYHMTVLYLGDLRPGSAEVAQTVRVGGAPFKLHLDVLGSFRSAGVLWIGCRKAPEALLDLREKLARAVSHLGLHHDARPMEPHITCMRDLSGPARPEPLEPLYWTVEEYVLVRSLGGRYDVLTRFPLNQLAASSGVKSGQAKQQGK